MGTVIFLVVMGKRECNFLGSDGKMGKVIFLVVMGKWE